MGETCLISEITEDSKYKIWELINEDLLHPIIKEIYGTESFADEEQTSLNSYFLLNNKCLQGLEMNTFDSSWDIIKNIFIKSNEFLAITPVNWYLEESSKSSYF